jgi:hypothetical protein
VEEAIYGLLKFPEQGRLRYFKTLEVNDLRTIVVPGLPNHLIFYRYLAEENVLLIVYAPMADAIWRRCCLIPLH